MVMSGYFSFKYAILSSTVLPAGVLGAALITHVRSDETSREYYQKSLYNEKNFVPYITKIFERI